MNNTKMEIFCYANIGDIFIDKNVAVGWIGIIISNATDCKSTNNQRTRAYIRRRAGWALAKYSTLMADLI